MGGVDDDDTCSPLTSQTRSPASPYFPTEKTCAQIDAMGIDRQAGQEPGLWCQGSLHHYVPKPLPQFSEGWGADEGLFMPASLCSFRNEEEGSRMG